MNDFIKDLLPKLYDLLQIADNLTGDHLPDTIIDDGKKLAQFVKDTAANIKQKVPLNQQEEEAFDTLIEEVTSRDYWKSKK